MMLFVDVVKCFGISEWHVENIVRVIDVVVVL